MKRIIIKKLHSRRSFITKLVGAGIVISLPFIDSCTTVTKANILNERQESILRFTLQFLYPDDNFGPKLNQIITFNYFIWTLVDKNIDPEENQYLLDGLKWIDETSVESHTLHFEKLDDKKKYKLLNTVVNKEWGENYFSKVLTVIVESMFADPIYGSNPEGIIWEWFGHNPGQPRPTEINKYTKLLERKNESVIITNLSQL